MSTSTQPSSESIVIARQPAGAWLNPQTTTWSRQIRKTGLQSWLGQTPVNTKQPVMAVKNSTKSCKVRQTEVPTPQNLNQNLLCSLKARQLDYSTPRSKMARKTEPLRLRGSNSLQQQLLQQSKKLDTQLGQSCRAGPGKTTQKSTSATMTIGARRAWITRSPSRLRDLLRLRSNGRSTACQLVYQKYQRQVTFALTNWWNLRSNSPKQMKPTVSTIGPQPNVQLVVCRKGPAQLLTMAGIWSVRLSPRSQPVAMQRKSTPKRALELRSQTQLVKQEDRALMREAASLRLLKRKRSTVMPTARPASSVQAKTLNWEHCANLRLSTVRGCWTVPQFSSCAMRMKKRMKSPEISPIGTSRIRKPPANDISSAIRYSPAQRDTAAIARPPPATLKSFWSQYCTLLELKTTKATAYGVVWSRQTELKGVDGQSEGVSPGRDLNPPANRAEQLVLVVLQVTAVVASLGHWLIQTRWVPIGLPVAGAEQKRQGQSEPQGVLSDSTNSPAEVGS